MIQHVWTVLCDRVVVDQSTNNVILHAIEQIRVGGLPTLEAGQGLLVPLNLKVASLWIRTSDDSEKGESRVAIYGPDESALAGGSFELVVDKRRARTFMDFPAIPLRAAGIYHYVLELKQGEDWTEVARLPLEIDVEQAATDAAEDGTATP